MIGEKRIVDLLIFYLVSFVVLVVSGLIYKILFVVYNYVQFSSLAISEISYALIWGVRFDIASAGYYLYLAASFSGLSIACYHRKIQRLFCWLFCWHSSSRCRSVTSCTMLRQVVM